MLHSSYWRRIFSLVKTVYFTCELSPSSRNRHLYEWKPFFKNRTYSCQWKLILQLVEIIFFHCLRYFSRSSSSCIVETNFSVQKKEYCILLRTFFPASGNHYLNYKEAYLKLLSLLLTTTFFDFSDIPAVCSFFLQQKRIYKQILHSCQWKPIFCLPETVFFHLEIFFCQLKP